MSAKYKVYTGKYEDDLDLADILCRLFPHVVKKINTGDLVVLKPNMFRADPYFYTNPILLKKAARFFKEMGARVVIAERSKAMEQVFKAHSEIYTYAEAISFDDMPVKKISINGATSLRQDIGIPAILLECDYLIGVPQFRTHAGMYMSNALKNMVGILPGFTTRIVHNVGLTEAIVDLNRIRVQDMVISDLITTIEGNYPIDGIPVNRNLLVIGDNALAVDLAVADISGFDVERIEYLRLAAKEGMGPDNLDELEIIGSSEDLRFNCFKSGMYDKKSELKINFDYESACPECQRFCNSLAEFLDKHAGMDGEITIASGCGMNTRISGGSESRTILVGHCTYRYRNNGIYIEGCPPRAIQAHAVLEWLKNNGNVNELYQNQCRWPRKTWKNDCDGM